MPELKSLAYRCVHSDTHLSFDSRGRVNTLGRIRGLLTIIWGCATITVLQVIKQELGECGTER